MRLRLLCTVVALAGLALTYALGTAGGSSGSEAVAAAPRTVKLTIVFQKASGAKQRFATVRCRGRVARATGWLDNRPSRACTVARRQSSFLLEGPETDAGGSCLAAVYGEERATIYGTIGSRTINRRFSRHDSCAERDYQRVVRLFPKG